MVTPGEKNGRQEEGVIMEDLEPIAGLSCAASCICLKLFGKEFRPVFTHQCFEGEYIRGYAPVEEAAEKAAELAAQLRKDQNKEIKSDRKKVVSFWGENKNEDEDEEEAEILPHSSYRQKSKASFCLSVDVTLAPSCLYSAVSIHLERKGERRKKSRRKASKNVSYVDDDDMKFGSDDYSESSSSIVEEIETPTEKRKHHEEQIKNNNFPNKRIRSVNITSRKDKDNDSISLGSEDTSASDHDNDDENDSYQDDDEIDNDEDYHGDTVDNATPQGRTRTRRMEIEEIVQRVARALPSIQYYSETSKDKQPKQIEKYLSNPEQRMSIEEINNHFLDSTIGDKLCHYSRSVKQCEDDTQQQSTEEQRFFLCLANGKDPSTTAFHGQVQKLALWYIETAEGVDVASDEGGGFWKVLYLFQEHKRMIPKSTTRKDEDYQYSLVGFVTLFFFFSPFKKPKPGLVMRICQIVILPPYQRKGHGKKMLHTIYDIAQKKYDAIIGSSDSLYNIQDGITEINVEAPAPSFIALRNRLDFELLKANIILSTDKSNFTKQWLPEKYFDEDSFDTLLESDAVEAAANAKITPIQMHISYELLKLESLETQIKQMQSSKDDISETVEELRKKYRLMVKKRLNVTNRDILGKIHTKGEKQLELANIFDKTNVKYEKILGLNK